MANPAVAGAAGAQAPHNPRLVLPEFGGQSYETAKVWYQRFNRLSTVSLLPFWISLQVILFYYTKRITTHAVRNKCENLKCCERALQNPLYRQLPLYTSWHGQ